MRRLSMLTDESEVAASILGSMAAACECECDGNIPIGADGRAGQDRRGREARSLRVKGRAVLDARRRRRAWRPRSQAPAGRRPLISSPRSIRSTPRPNIGRIEDVPLSSYDAVLACIPDEPKIEMLEYLLGNGKHVLVEKPLWARRRRID